MLAMYVHTHWGYNHPYAARTWTVEDWRGYLGALRALGYDAVMFWPLFDSMPPRPTASDRAFLARTAAGDRHRASRVRHAVSAHRLSQRDGQRACRLVYLRATALFHLRTQDQPRATLRRSRLCSTRAGGNSSRWRLLMAWQSSTATRAAIIGSTNAEFVDCHGPAKWPCFASTTQVECVYWVWVGWENYNRFWAQAQQGGEGHAEPDLQIDPQVFTDALERRARSIPEPWSLLLAWPEHLAATRAAGPSRQALLYPLRRHRGRAHLSPDQLCTRKGCASAVERYPGEPFPRGVIGNCQTHCLQIPHTYLFAHYARGGSVRHADLGWAWQRD